MFWNLRTNGSFDVRTLHGSCPVAFGSKWVIVKWISWKPQELKLPCLHEDYGNRRHQPLDNRMCHSNRCNMNHEVYYNSKTYYENLLRQF